MVPGPQPPAVSVVVPTYERRELVVRAVRSALAQTFRDLEVIVADDGSTDGTGEAVAALDSPRVRYLRQRNRGPSAARNAGIAVARGELVAFLDSDNLWRPEHVAVLVDAFARWPEAVLAATVPFAPAAGLIHPLPRELVASSVGFTTAVAVRRRELDAVGGFDEQLWADEDGDLWLRLAFRGPFAVVRRRTVAIRATRESLWERNRRRGAFLDSFERSSRRLAAEVATLNPELAPRAAGRLELSRVLRALARDDRDAVRRGLERACRLLPELSSEPEAVLRRLTVFLPAGADREGAWRICATAAELWPDPRAPSAIMLRLYAAVAALRLGRPREAARLVQGLPAGAALRLGARSGPLVARVAVRRLDRLLHCGREATDLGSVRHVGEDDGAHRDDGAGSDREMVAHHGGHPDERVLADADVAGDVRSRVERDERSDPSVVADEDASPKQSVSSDRRMGADDDARRDDRAHPDVAPRRDVGTRVDDRDERPPGALET